MTPAMFALKQLNDERRKRERETMPHLRAVELCRDRRFQEWLRAEFRGVWDAAASAVAKPDIVADFYDPVAAAEHVVRTLCCVADLRAIDCDPSAAGLLAHIDTVFRAAVETSKPVSAGRFGVVLRWLCDAALFVGLMALAVAVGVWAGAM